MTTRIAIVGLQHQGVVQAACFANMGYSVLAIDDDAVRVASLEKGRSNLNEPDLDFLLLNGIRNGLLRFSADYEELKNFDAPFVFLSIDVPFDSEGLKLDSLYETTAKIRLHSNPFRLLCVTSQVPVGISRSLTFGSVAYIPELLRPGRSVKDFMQPDRVIIGSNEDRIIEQVASLYYPLSCPIRRMSLQSAEMSKHVHNAILATQISFANEMADICRAVGANPADVMEATRLDDRVGKNSYLNPGWTLSGGHLIRDVRVLRGMGVNTPLMDAVLAVDKDRIRQ